MDHIWSPYQELCIFQGQVAQQGSELATASVTWDVVVVHLDFGADGWMVGMSAIPSL